MDWLNYHHLHYFWIVAREGSVVAATRVLNLTQPTISAQIRLLEDSLGEKLFRKRGRGLVLTEVGRTVYEYAEEIFSLGQELRDVVRGRSTGNLPKLFVGLADVVPKLIAFRLLEPAFAITPRPHVVCREDSPQRLFASLAVNDLDLVICDSPIGHGVGVRAFNHLLGESGITIFATAELAKRHRQHFPRSLEGAPMLLPASGSESRRMLDHWFEVNDVRPSIVAEATDSALLKRFGHAGLGLFPGPTAIEKEIVSQYKVSIVGRFEELRERFFVVSAERRIKHPAVAAITDGARRLFG
jgi:LysR family transcriptional activator of nhaA